MRYIYLVNEHVDREAVQVFMTDVAPEAKDAIMTLGQQLIQEGERGMLLRLLRKRFGDQITAELEQRIATASRDQLAIWSDRILSATTLHEVLAG